MKRDPLYELFNIGRLYGNEQLQIMLHEWAARFVKTASTRHYSDRIKNKNVAKFQKHVEEKLQHELAQFLVKEAFMDSIDETETAHILTKTIFVLGDSNK